MLTTTGLGLLWTVPSYSTTVCLSVRRDEDRGALKIRGLARFDSHGRTRVQLRGLNPLPGHQYSALVSSLPLPAPHRAPDRWAYGTGEDALQDLAVPASGCR